MTPVRLEPAASRSRVKHSTAEPLHSIHEKVNEYDQEIPQSHDEGYDIDRLVLAT